MKQAIRVGLIVVVLGGGSLLIWKTQQTGWTIQGQAPAEFILSGFNSAAVVKIQPFMPPVIELVDEQQSAVDLRGYPDPEMEIDMENPSLDETGAGLTTEVGNLSEAAAKTIREEKTTADVKVSPEEGEGSVAEEKEEERVAESYDQSTLDALFQAEKKASSQALKVLQIGREMSLESREIVQGGCWDYVDTVYNRAGYTGEQRRVIFQGGEEMRQYADREMMLPGDWLFYINHNYREARHSAIFIDWIDYEKQIGLMLSYGGEGRGEPARYKAYELSHVYNIVRPVKK
ncbi:MAG: hypothetical protein D3903_00955 [Candidatus Electrothrix sp. GM3_4]|nr:hypothetical protein [Candidatus Electrothrix sp. GM3_4]